MQGTIYTGIISGRIGEERNNTRLPTTHAFQLVNHPRIFARDFNQTIPNEVPQGVVAETDPKLTCK